ncbi:MAG: hypothetical protein K8R45_06000 [Desulfobacterales bacterium]|nr:hypothetical protein [Desulfobacterales bacterium]
MQLQNIFSTSHINSDSNAAKAPHNNKMSFQSVLEGNLSGNVNDVSIKTTPMFTLIPSDIPLEFASNIASGRDVSAAYKKAQNQYGESDKISDISKYKDDQLLSNPGGDDYYLDQRKVAPHPEVQESFWGRVGKDISDAFSNVKNFFKDLFFGSKIKYRDENNQIQEAGQRGLLGSVVDFFKGVGSALSFGSWRPNGEKEPQGVLERIGFFVSNVKKAIFGDLIQGAGRSLIHMGEDLILAGWNLIEVIPDATVGNFNKGRELVTDLFDNGQVVLDYLTDILPFGDAWQRVHATNLGESDLPIISNLKKPEHYPEDVRWRYVRNTPFRKAIETAGSLLADFMTLKILGHTKLFSDKNRNGN